MARPDDRGDARPRRAGSSRAATGRKDTSKGKGRRAAPRRATTGRAERPERRGSPRDRAMEGGFGPWGAPRTPERDRRPDVERPERGEPRSALRLTGTRGGPVPAPRRARTEETPTRGPRRRRRPPAGVEVEITRLGGKRAPFLLDRVTQATEAFAHDRDLETLRLLRPVRDAVPEAPSVRELCGLAQYRLGNYRAAAKELEEFASLTDSVEQHPVLMDCYRAQRRWKRVDVAWQELATASPSAELVTEGRIVAAGSLADRGELEAALTMLRRKAGDVKRPRDHHLRLWYALADLEERAGNLARARSLFGRVAAHDRELSDVADRLAALA